MGRRINKRAETGTGVTGDTVLRTSITGLILIVLVLWAVNSIVQANAPNQIETLNKFIEAAENAKDNYPFIRTISIRDHYLYGFNAGADYLAVEKEKGDAVQKPDTAMCNTGACLCLCDKGCKAKEKTYCKRVEGINKFFAKSDFRGANEGAKRGENYLVAINSDKQKIICVLTERQGDDMTFSECAVT